jgi:hypothetical protein
MKFRTCTYPKDYRVEYTPRKLAAAERRLARKRDEVALLPDLVAKVPTLEQEIAFTEKAGPQAARNWRDRWAQTWRRARRDLEKLPPITRKGVLRYWNNWVDNDAPGSPEYFATFVDQAAKGVSFWERLRELRQFKLIGQGKLAKDALFIKARERSTHPWRHRDYHDRDIARFRRKRARKLGLLKIELQTVL